MANVLVMPMLNMYITPTLNFADLERVDLKCAKVRLADIKLATNELF